MPDARVIDSSNSCGDETMTQRAIVLHGPVEARPLLRTALAIIVLAGVVVFPAHLHTWHRRRLRASQDRGPSVLALVGGVLFLGYLMVGGPIDRSADASVDMSLWCFVGLYIAAAFASVDVGQSLAGEPFQY